MNRAIRHLFLVFALLFGLLIAFTSRWSVFEAKSLANNTANRRPLLEQQRIPRGLILADDGTPIAKNVRKGKGPTLRYVRTYPQGDLFGHPVGYSYVQNGRSGNEKSQNDVLTGQDNAFGDLLGSLNGGSQPGDDVRTTLDPKAQRTALAALGGRRGSIVAIEPGTGRIRVMVSVPTYDPNQVPQRFRQLNAEPSAPLFNRATQARYPPGSTFKVVTAAAALDSGRYTPDSLISGRNGKRIGGVPLQNFGGEDPGVVTLTDALTHSINTVFGEVGETLGKRTMYRYMRRFGFGTDPPIDYPPEQMSPSGVFGRRGLLGPGDPVDIGRVAIGQERLQVTPLQMAMVAAGVANHGVLMTPRLVDRVTAPDGRIRQRVRPQRLSQVMKRSSADQLAGMMSQVVKAGTGTAAALKGVQVAGKTGTAEVAGGSANQAWFIAFAPVHGAKMAIAVTVERTQQSQTGGEVAAPLAKRVLESLLR